MADDVSKDSPKEPVARAGDPAADDAAAAQESAPAGGGSATDDGRKAWADAEDDGAKAHSEGGGAADDEAKANESAGAADEAMAGETPAPLLRLSGLEKHYGDEQALGPVDLELEGRCVGLLGPNGAGKSTLLRLIMGLMHPSSGTIEVLGDPVHPDHVDLRRRIGYAPEGDAQFPGLSGVESVSYAGRLVGMSAPDAMQRAHQVLDYVGLQEARYRRVSTYSTGMRQRLKIAQALVHDPGLLILDEPTEGVDPQARDEIIGLIDELSRVHGIRVIVSTHLLADVERLATHAIVLDGGRVVAAGDIDTLQRREGHGYVVRVVGDPAPLGARLDEAGISWQAVEPELRVETDDAAGLLRHVQAAGLVVRHLAPMRLRLDEAFELAVGGGSDA